MLKIVSFHRLVTTKSTLVSQGKLMKCDQVSGIKLILITSWISKGVYVKGYLKTLASK